MGEQEAFGPNLRRVRVQRGISLERIAASTKVSTDLWSALERSDFSQWPSGIYARAYVRAYATEIGIDPDTTVDTFCRLFPNGDRRAERVVRGQAQLVGHDLRWEDDLVGSTIVEKRAAPKPEPGDAPPIANTGTGRVVAAVLDLACVVAIAGTAATFLPLRWSAALGVCAVAYHAISLVAIGSTPSVWLVDTYIVSRHPTRTRTAGAPRFLRLLQRRQV
jgi:transcriptional regulator with XRE-family HTH domain